MLKNVKMSKILLSLIAILLMIVLFGNVYSLADEGNNTSSITITPVTAGASSDNNTTAGNNTINTINATNISNTANSINTVNTPNISTVSASANNTVGNTSIYNNTNSVSNSSNLPYTGTSSKGILLIVVFVISSVYAYKKVSDYNI